MVNINMYKIAKAKLSPNLTCVKERQCQIVVVCVLQLRTHTQYSHKSQGSTTRPLCASSTHTVLTRSSPQRSHHKRSKWPTVRPTTVSPRLCTCSGGPTIGWLVQLLVGRLFAQVVQHSNHWLGDYLLRWSGGWVP